jgi:flagellar biosynthetic protein FliO
MAKLKWLALMPILAAVLVFSLSFMETPKNNGVNTASSAAASRDVRSSSAQGEKATSSLDMAELAVSLLAVLGLAIGAIWMLKKLQKGTQSLGQAGQIQIKESRRLGPKRAIHIVRVDERLLLLGESESGLSFLADLTPPEEETPLARTSVPDVQDELDVHQGAEPRDFVIRAAAKPRAEAASDERPASLGNFRELLQRLGHSD